MGVDLGLNTVNGTTHFGQKMFTFSSRTDRILYSVNLRRPFNRYIARLPKGQRFKIPRGWIIHMHDLATDSVNHIAYQTLHTIATRDEINEEESTTEETESTASEKSQPEADEEYTGRWVLAVNTNPRSPNFKKVTVIDLSNGQYVPRFPTAESTFGKTPYGQRFVHAHFVAVDPARHVLLVTGEHTGNLGVVNTITNKLEQVISISKRIPGCKVKGPLEPHVHGVSIDQMTGTAYVSDEANPCMYQSVTILEPSP